MAAAADVIVKRMAFSSLTGLSIMIAQQVLKDLLQEQDRPIAIESIQKAVADRYGIKPAQLKKKSNRKEIVRPRQMAMYLVRELTRASLSEIGHVFGEKDHTTVIHSIAKIKALCLSDSDANQLIQRKQDSHIIESIQKAVADRYGIKPAQLKKKSNRKEIVRPRQMAMYLVRELTRASLSEIGHVFGGKHNTTVIHSIAKIQALRSSDPGTENLIDTVMDSFQ